MTTMYVLHSPVSPASVYDNIREAEEWRDNEIEYRKKNLPADMKELEGTINEEEYKIVSVKIDS